MTTVNLDLAEQFVCRKPEAPITGGLPGECVMLHFPATFPFARKSGEGRAAGARESGHWSGSKKECPHLDLTQLSAEKYAFSGAQSAPIVMSISPAGVASFSQCGAKSVNSLLLNRRRAVELCLCASEQVVVDAAELQGWPIYFTGEGLVEISGMNISPAVRDNRGVTPASATPDISLAMRPHGAEAKVNVNGREVDTIAVRWIYLERAGIKADAGTGRDYWQAIAKVELALQYVKYLHAGGRALDDFIVHFELDGVGRPVWQQTLHDNLLAELNASTLRARLIHNAYPVPEKLALTREGLFQLYSDFAGALTERPYCAGRNPLEHDADCAALAFDFDQGWSRSNYLWRGHNIRLARAAISPERGMWVDRNVTVEAFHVARHEGAGVELALRARSGNRVARSEISASGERVIYYISTGEPALEEQQNWTACRWHVDLSVCTRLNGVVTVLDEFQFLLRIRRRMIGKEDFECQFELTRPGVLYHPKLGEVDVGRAWLLRNPSGGIALSEDGMITGGFGDEMDEQVGQHVSQCVVNLGVPFLRRMLERVNTGSATDNPDIFGPAVYDFCLEAYTRCGSVLVENHIQVRFT